MRKSGILLPISSLPSEYGIGSFSKEAYDFVDCLEKAGQSYWQILPLGPTGYGDSPYQSFSTFAGNPYFIDLDELVKKGYLTSKECRKYDFGDDEQSIDYEKIYLSRFKALKKAYLKSNIEENEAFKEFIKKNAFWLDDYSLYMAIKNEFNGVSWSEWDAGIKRREPYAVEYYKEKFVDEIEFYQFQQFEFFEQWMKLKEYANQKGIKIIGDIPIYVAFDSSDTWANTKLFQLDEKQLPIGVAGCPPDSFAADGQLWGNPLYHWEYHKETKYHWWTQRIAHCFTLYDVVRIDHFRGFDEYYYIPYPAVDARNGTWKKGPGYDIFQTFKEELGERDFIAEDLGFLTPSVIELVKKSGYPGMKILQFAFDSREENDYLPHNYNDNCVVYSGTHDNDTIKGWYKTLTSSDQGFCKKYLKLDETKEKDIDKEIIKAAMSSKANLAVIPMQDYLGLGEEARINIPSTVGTNWKWRMSKTDFTNEIIAEIHKMTETCDRI